MLSNETRTSLTKKIEDNMNTGCLCIPMHACMPTQTSVPAHVHAGATSIFHRRSQHVEEITGEACFRLQWMLVIWRWVFARLLCGFGGRGGSGVCREKHHRHRQCRATRHSRSDSRTRWHNRSSSPCSRPSTHLTPTLTLTPACMQRHPSVVNHCKHTDRSLQASQASNRRPRLRGKIDSRLWLYARTD